MRQIFVLVMIIVLTATVGVSAQSDDLCEVSDAPAVAPSTGVRAMMILSGLQSGDTTATETLCQCQYLYPT